MKNYFRSSSTEEMLGNTDLASLSYLGIEVPLTTLNSDSGGHIRYFKNLSKISCPFFMLLYLNNFLRLNDNSIKSD